MKERIPGAMVKHLPTISPQAAIGMLVEGATAYQLGRITNLENAVADAARQVRDVITVRGVDQGAWLGVVSDALQARIRCAGLSPSAPTDRFGHAPSALQRRVDYLAAVNVALRAL